MRKILTSPGNNKWNKGKGGLIWKFLERREIIIMGFNGIKALCQKKEGLRI